MLGFSLIFIRSLHCSLFRNRILNFVKLFFLEGHGIVIFCSLLNYFLFWNVTVAIESAETNGGARWREHQQLWRRRCLRYRGIRQVRRVVPKFRRRKSESRFEWDHSTERNKLCTIWLLGIVWMSKLLCSRIQTRRGLQHHTPSVCLNFFSRTEFFLNWN